MHDTILQGDCLAVKSLIYGLAAQDELFPTQGENANVCNCWPSDDHDEPNCLYHRAWELVTQGMTDEQRNDFRRELHIWRDHSAPMPQ
jgi:hypothetical protein